MKSIKWFYNEFKPALHFLMVFIGVYVALSILYGLYIESFGENVDPWTRNVTDQVAFLLSGSDNSVYVIDRYNYRACSLGNQSGSVIAVFEGCNGINVVILFIAFVVAYRGPVKKSILFTLAGVLIIHVVNLARVSGLYFVAKLFPDYMYFTHKYLFTAVIYAVVFALWYLWVSKYNVHPKFSRSPETA